jgi:hypothetical protein
MELALVQGEGLAVPERVIVAPSVGVFRPLFGHDIACGQNVDVGQAVGVIEGRESRPPSEARSEASSPVCSPTTASVFVRASPSPGCESRSGAGLRQRLGHGRSRKDRYELRDGATRRHDRRVDRRTTGIASATLQPYRHDGIAYRRRPAAIKTPESRPAQSTCSSWRPPARAADPHTGASSVRPRASVWLFDLGAGCSSSTCSWSVRRSWRRKPRSRVDRRRRSSSASST